MFPSWFPIIPFSLGPWVLPPDSLILSGLPKLLNHLKFLSNPFHFLQHKTYWKGTLHLHLLLFLFSLPPMKLSSDTTCLEVLSHRYSAKYRQQPPLVFPFSLGFPEARLSSNLVTFSQTLVLAPPTLLTLFWILVIRSLFSFTTWFFAKSPSSITWMHALYEGLPHFIFLPLSSFLSS